SPNPQRVTERIHEPLAGPVAVLRPLLERRERRATGLLVQGAGEAARRGRRLGDVLQGQRRRRRIGKRQAAPEPLIEDDGRRGGGGGSVTGCRASAAGEGSSKGRRPTSIS